MTLPKSYPDFPYKADQLSKFFATLDMVTILLKDGNIIHHSPKDILAFVKWLNDNQITDLKSKKVD